MVQAETEACLLYTVIALDIFKTRVVSVRWRKWFMETGQTIAVTGQMRGCLYYW